MIGFYIVEKFIKNGLAEFPHNFKQDFLYCLNLQVTRKWCSKIFSVVYVCNISKDSRSSFSPQKSVRKSHPQKCQ